MLIPKDIHPEKSIYYTASLVLAVLKEEGDLDFLDLFARLRLDHKMSFVSLVYSLDWLYLIQMVEMDKEGMVRRCISEA